MISVINKILIDCDLILFQELTGVPACDLPDSPTHPGLPMRRKVGTAFEFDESILKPTTTCNMEVRYFSLRDLYFEGFLTGVCFYAPSIG